MEKKCKKHGLHSKWKNTRTKGFVCRLCILEKRKQQRIVINYNSLKEQYGEILANEYLKVSNNENAHMNTWRALGRRLKLGEQFVNADRSVIYRIQLLNAIIDAKIDNIGWNCETCNVYHDLFFFLLED